MKKYSIIVFLFVFSMTYVFAQTPVKSRKLKGEWELQIEFAEAVAEETKDLGVFEGKNLIHFNEDGSRVKNVYLIRRR